VRAVGLDAALGEIAVEQVEAAGITEFPDLPEQLKDRHCGIGAAAAQMVAVRVGQRGPVLRARCRRAG
jgi:hypothetical protein